MTNEKMLDLAKSVGAIIVESGVLFVGYEQLDKYTQAATLAAAPQWLPIADAPEGTMILCANMKATEARHWAYVAWVVDGKVCGHRMDMPTHWQPLPLPPTATPQGNPK